MLIEIPDVLGKAEVQALRQQLQAAPWATGLSAGPQALLVKKNLQIPENNDHLRDMRVIVMRALNRSNTLVSAALPYKVVPPNFNCYTVEHPSYGPHIDNTLRYLPDGSALRTDISATLFLSEPEEYEGGELVIHDTYGIHQVKLGAGGLVIYPSGSVHEVKPVTRGQRFACYLFIQSMVKDTEARRMLFEMDNALIKLREQFGQGHPELVTLTGLYHNLLRRWSDC